MPYFIPEESMRYTVTVEDSAQNAFRYSFYIDIVVREEYTSTYQEHLLHCQQTEIALFMPMDLAFASCCNSEYIIDGAKKFSLPMISLKDGTVTTTDNFKILTLTAIMSKPKCSTELLSRKKDILC
jgi:hypothetical protein